MAQSNVKIKLSNSPAGDSTLPSVPESKPPAGLIFRKARKMEPTMNALIRDRKALAEELSLLLDCEHDAHVEAIERCSATGIGQQPKSYTAEITAAREKLAAFDSAHPEVKQEIERRRQERIKRHVWD